MNTHQPQEGKYPSAELVSRWLAEEDDPDFSATAAQKYAFIARKACDWQREQDALICAGFESVTALNCADAIRHGSQEHE